MISEYQVNSQKTLDKFISKVYELNGLIEANMNENNQNNNIEVKK